MRGVLSVKPNRPHLIHSLLHAFTGCLSASLGARTLLCHKQNFIMSRAKNSLTIVIVLELTALSLKIEYVCQSQSTVDYDILCKYSLRSDPTFYIVTDKGFMPVN